MRKVNADDQIPVDVWLDEKDVVDEKDSKKFNKFASVTGAKGYRWKEAELIKDDFESQIDMIYYNNMADEAKNHIMEFCDYDLFVSDDDYIVNNVVYSKKELNEDLPWDNN